MQTSKLFLTLLTVSLLASCGGSGGEPDTTLKIEKWPPSGDNQTDTVGLTLPQVIRVKVTVGGQVSAGYMVHFDGGDLGTDSMLTGGDGIATSTWTLNGSLGTQAVTASLDGAEGSPLTFHATAVAGTPVLLKIASGDSQIAVINAFFSQAAVARLVDQFGNGVPGQYIHFSSDGGVSITADSIITGPTGLAALGMQATGTNGVSLVTASYGSVSGSPLTFHALVAQVIDTVLITDSAYTSDNVSISAGSAVVWRWISGTHSVTPDSLGAFPATDAYASPHTFGPVYFASPGTFTYHCTVHAGMTGTISVN